jgi:hypothetical protein
MAGDSVPVTNDPGPSTSDPVSRTNDVVRILYSSNLLCITLYISSMLHPLTKTWDWGQITFDLGPVPLDLWPYNQ